MKYSLFVITQEDIDETAIMDFEREKIYIRPFIENIEEGMTGHFYYEITNGNSPEEEDVNPYNKIEGIHEVLKMIHELGSFKLVILDSEKKVQDLLAQEHGNIEKAFTSLTQEKVDLDNLLERYPHMIDTNRIYIID
ncbi:hypothetical protein [Clostridium thermarum]|uniref:hypothetical protein n=1 Tax=Clostridium thermarum TaxID=1716543 RepID=UPI001122B8BC|nr:hypothetical protein [Clostridium thermarum]